MSFVIAPEKHIFLPLFRLFILMLALTLPAAGRSKDAETTLLRQALTQAQQQDWRSFEKTRRRLPSNFVLHDYLAQLQLEHQSGRLERKTVEQWQKRYPNSALRNQVLQRSLFAFARQQSWEDYLALSPEHPSTPELRCFRGQALIASEHPQARAYAETLWLEGRSQPAACDNVFNWLQRQGHRTDELVWQRFMLAFEAGNSTLMKYLHGQLKNSNRKQLAERTLDLVQHPHKVKYLFAGDGHSQLALSTVLRLADKDPQQALRLLPMLSKRFAWNEQQKQKLQQRIAWFSVIREEAPNRQWLDSYLSAHSEKRLLEQRARRALIEQDWQTLAHWIALLPETDRNSARWQYWLARTAAQQNNHEQARTHFAQAARQRSFWGFLAAEKLGLPVPLNRTNTPRELSLDGLQPTLRRVQLFMATNLNSQARQEWLQLLRGSNQNQLESLANYAAQQQWHHFAIEAALQGRMHDVLLWRFPIAFREDFVQAEETSGVDQWLLMAVARRESAFNPDARSHAGALGLMQVMPATASTLARTQGWPRPAQDDLLKPLTSLQYGSQYLSQMLERYQNNRVLALAAYNAGPHRADRWLNNSPRPVDLFIESIPFYETREYVQAVLTYRVILAHQAGLEQIQLLTEAEQTFSYTQTELADNG